MTLRRKNDIANKRRNKITSASKVRYICEKECYKSLLRIKIIEKLEIIAIIQVNIKFHIPKEISVVFHNGSYYGYHFIIIIANKFKVKFECLGEFIEKYKTFSVPIEQNLEKFIFIKMVMKVL